MPTTYVWSDGDVAIGRTAAEACADYVTGDYRFVELPGVTHWIPEQAPEQLAAAILDRIASSDLDQADRRGQPARPPARSPARPAGGVASPRGRCSPTACGPPVPDGGAATSAAVGSRA